MRVYKFIVVCALSLLLAACFGGIDGLSSDVDLLEGSGAADLNAEVWYQGGSYKSVLNWDAISGAQSYNLFWAGNVTYANMGTVYAYLSGITGTISLNELEEQLEALGIAVSYGDVVTTAVDYEHLALSEERSYCYMVTGMAGDEPVGSTDIECVSTLAIPSLTTASASGSVTITWLPVDGAAKYYVYRSIPVGSPSISVVKAAALLDDSECEGIEPDELVGETSELSLNDDNGGEKLSNCLDYCYTVVPEDENGNLIRGETQVRIASPITQGVLDTSFGNGGTTTYAGQSTFSDIALSSDDQIVTIYGDKVIKYNADGTDILWTVDLSASVDSLTSLVVDVDESGNESVFVTGSSAGTSVQMIVCKVLNGALDINFGPNSGCYSYTGTATSKGNDVALDSAGRVIIAGQTPGSGGGPLPGQNFFVWRLSADGMQVDWTYSNAAVSAACAAYAVTTIDDSGTENVVAVGYSQQLSFTAQYFPSLVIIKLDGDDGSYITSGSETGAMGLAVAIASDGSVLIGGQKYFGIFGPTDLRIWNYSSDISAIDSSQYDEGTMDEGTYVGSDCREKTLFGGTSNQTGAMISRYDSSFVLDDTFGNGDPIDGWFIRSAASSIKLAEDSLGRLIVAGSVNGAPSLWRLE